MITVKVTTADGDSWLTEINCSLEEAQKYYMGVVFENQYEMPMQPVISVELQPNIIH